MNNTHHSKFTPQPTRHQVFGWWLLLVLLLALPVSARAQFNYSINNGTVTITGYNGPGGAVTIPDWINGLPVTSIGYNAFTDCTRLTNLTIPKSLTSIGRQAFWHCTNLTSISVDGLNSTYSSVNGVLFNKTQITLVQYPPGIAATSYTIPDSVTSIGEGAFEFGARLTNVSIPNGVTSIGDYAFWACNSLTNPTIPNSVTNIGDSAFSECTSLTSITIPNRVTRIGVGTFGDCTRLTSITIPDSVTTIGTNAFFDCAGLTSVTIGSGVTDIRFLAFYECTNLTALHFEGNAPSLGGYVFQDDNRATVYYLPGTTGWGTTFGGLPTALWQQATPDAWTLSASSITTNTAMLNGMVNPNGYATSGWFQWGTTTNYGNLTSVSNLGSGTTALPLSVPLAGLTLNVTYHFRIAATNDNGLACGSDQSFSTTPSEGDFNYTITDGTVTITKYTGVGGAVTIPSTINGLPVTRAAYQAFYDCLSLTSLTIPDCLTSLGDSAFAYCSSLTNVTLGNGVTSIGNNAFDHCTSLTSLTIPDSVTSIGGVAFNGCARLTNVTIGNGVTNIGDYAFYSCTSLMALHFRGNAPSLGGPSVFGNTSATVYYLPGTTGWDTTFGGLPTAPWQQATPGALTLSATAVTATTATLNGTVNPNGWPTTAWFQWGATTNYGSLTSAAALGSGTSALPLSAPVAGLTPNVTYHFRVAATNDYGTVYDSDQSFTTATLPPPEVYTLSATAVTATTATLNGTVNPNGWPTTAWFQWGTTTNYGNLTPVTDVGSGTTPLPFSAALAGLAPGVTYHFCVAATNDNGLAYGSEQSFTAAPPPFTDANWVSLGSGINGGVEALVVSGTNLYAGGGFTTAGGVRANNIAKWDGSAWSALGSGMNGGVNALAVSGTNLYAGGWFTTAGGVRANNIAKWDGSAWSALGSGVDWWVRALAVSGTNLYAGGSCTFVGGVPTSYIVKWDGGAWSALGLGMTSGPGYQPSVLALAVDGAGHVFAGGYFTTAGGVLVNYIAKWDGSAWSALGSGMDPYVVALAVSGTNLYAGGDFQTGGVSANSIAKWNGSSWSALGSGVNMYVWALAVSGTNLYAGGGFTTAGGAPANYIAKWNGSAWSGLGSGLNNNVYALAVDGVGHLFVGGAFTHAGTNVSPSIAEAILEPRAPTILKLPPTQTAEAGATVHLAVNAAGEPPPAYRWYFNGTNLLGCASSDLVLTNILFSQCRVSAGGLPRPHSPKNRT